MDLLFLRFGELVFSLRCQTSVVRRERGPGHVLLRRVRAVIDDSRSGERRHHLTVYEGLAVSLTEQRELTRGKPVEICIREIEVVSGSGPKTRNAQCVTVYA